MRSQNKNLKNIRESFICTTPIAHRGLHDKLVPENSFASFQSAIEEGYAIETDIRLTKDGIPVIIHDDKLTRLTGVDKKVIHCTYKEIESFGLLDSKEKVMTLEDCLGFIDGKVPLLLEVKDTPFHGDFPEKIIRILSNYNGEYAVQSFNPFYVHAFKRLAPHIARGQLAVGLSREVVVSCKDMFADFGIVPERIMCEGNISRKQVKNAIEKAMSESDFIEGHKHWKFDAWAIRTMIMNFITKPDFISYCCYNLPYYRVKRKEKRAVLSWTIRSDEEAQRISPWVDNYIFENIRPQKVRC